jgi:hypothetical protein
MFMFEYYGQIISWFDNFCIYIFLGFDNFCIYVFLGFYNEEYVREHPLFSDIPQVMDIFCKFIHMLLPFYRYSPIMSSINSFDFDPDCVVSIPPYDDEFCFPRSNNLTHISIAFRQFHDCVILLNQIGAQLHSFDVKIMHVRLSEQLDLSQISLVSNFVLFCNLI